MHIYPFKNKDEDLKKAVWGKSNLAFDEGKPRDPKIWRSDKYGSLMKYEEHGNTLSIHGWEIDHIRPEAKGGESNINNFQPLQWKNNREKSDTYPYPSLPTLADAPRTAMRVTLPDAPSGTKRAILADAPSTAMRVTLADVPSFRRVSPKRNK